MSAKNNTHFGTAVAVTVVVVVLIALIAGGMRSLLSGRSVDTDMSAEAVAARIKPVGQLNTGEPIAAVEAPPPAAAPAAAAARSGEEVYNTTCLACHAAGIAGAPKIGDPDAWDDRVAQGLETLVRHSIDGFQGKTGVMPPRGTCGNCSDDELHAAVEYMVSQLP